MHQPQRKYFAFKIHMYIYIQKATDYCIATININPLSFMFYDGYQLVHRIYCIHESLRDRHSLNYKYINKRIISVAHYF